MASEKRIMQDVRLALSPHATVFRANCGQLWTGDVVSNDGMGNVVLANARPVRTGLPNGFSDLFGWVRRNGIAQFLAIECKSENGRVSDEQAHFLSVVSAAGGLAGVARSADDALRIIKP